MLDFLTNVSFINALYCMLLLHNVKLCTFAITYLDIVSKNRCLIMALNSSVSYCRNDSKMYINNKKEAAELLYSPGEVVFSSIIVHA